MLEEHAAPVLAERVAGRLRARNAIAQAFFASEAQRITAAAQAMAERFLQGGRIYAFGRRAYATDAAHVAVEFAHPVIVGKRALPSLDISAAPEAFVDALVGRDDMALAFGPPQGDQYLLEILKRAHSSGALTLALPGSEADFGFSAPSDDPHVHQEIFEILGHTLYESIHVFLEHREDGHDIGAAQFLYPYLSETKQDTDALRADVAMSIVAKAREGGRLRDQVAATQAEAIAAAGRAIAERLRRGGRILTFGNGGSATDATDFALDCVEPGPGMRPVRALSLADEPATMSAIANDVGVELMFVRQIIARAEGNDIAFALSTSGGSRNVIAGLGEARKRGLLTVALLGYDGGEIARNGLADYAIVVDCTEIPRIQETQAAIYHVLREFL